MIHAQGFFLQTQNARSSQEHFLNSFINIAKNQNFSQEKVELLHLVELYLSFEETGSSGELLLNEITYFSRIREFVLAKKQLPLFRQLLASVLSNVQPQLKYERVDHLNKEFTNDTLNFMR